MAKKKVTEQELKDRLWKMVLESDMEDDGVEYHDDYLTWKDDYMRVIGNTLRKVSAFEGTASDIRKIIDEVDTSCLTDSCKKSLTKALKAALK